MTIGVLKADEPLPAIRTLATELKVNANTVQHAYRTLEQAGDVYVKRGLGTFVRTPERQHARSNPAGVARQLAERMLREAFRHGLLASDLIAALEEIAPGRTRNTPHPPGSDPTHAGSDPVGRPRIR